MDIAIYEMNCAIRGSLHVRGDIIFFFFDKTRSSRVPTTLSPEVMRPGRDFTHSTPSTAEARNEYSYNPAPPAYLHALQCQLHTLPD